MKERFPTQSKPSCVRSCKLYEQTAYICPWDEITTLIATCKKLLAKTQFSSKNQTLSFL